MCQENRCSRCDGRADLICSQFFIPNFRVDLPNRGETLEKCRIGGQCWYFTTNLARYLGFACSMLGKNNKYFSTWWYSEGTGLVHDRSMPGGPTHSFAGAPRSMELSTVNQASTWSISGSTERAAGLFCFKLICNPLAAREPASAIPLVGDWLLSMVPCWKACPPMLSLPIVVSSPWKDQQTACGNGKVEGGGPSIFAPSVGTNDQTHCQLVLEILTTTFKILSL